MFERIDIQRFRCFEAMLLDGLTRVNVFVGANQSGKTTALEAIALLADGSDVGPLEQTLTQRHGADTRLSPTAVHNRPAVDVRGLFHGGAPKPGASFAISGDDGSHVTVRLARDDGAPDQPASQTDGARPSEAEDRPQPSALWPDTGGTSTLRLDIRTHRGDARFRPKLGRVAPSSPRVPASWFLGATSPGIAGLVEAWKRAAVSERRDEVVGFLQVVDPCVRRIDVVREVEGACDLVIHFGDGRPPTPISGAGEGMRRLLALGVAVAETPDGGVLLIDGLDAGLHHTTLRPVWQLLLAASQTHAFQVFATTHSLDCLTALSHVTSETPALAAAVSVHRFEVGTTTTVRFDGAELSTAIEHALDVR